MIAIIVFTIICGSSYCMEMSDHYEDQNLRQRVERLENENMDLQRRLERLENDNYQRCQGNVAVDEQTINGDSMQKRILVSGVQDPDSKVAFSAYISQDLANISKGHIVIFDKTVTNNGNAYSTYSGEFTCRQAGIYVFFANVLAEGPHAIQNRITRNNEVLARTYSGDRDFFSSGSNMVTVHLDVGDRVWVEVEYSEPGSVLDFLWTTFSGFLL